MIANQAANLRGFHASVNPRFEAGIPDFMNGILNLSIHFNVVHVYKSRLAESSDEILKFNAC